MNRSRVKQLAPWGLVILLVACLVFVYRHAYEKGKRQGGIDATSEMLVLEVPGDLKLLITLLSAENRANLPDAEVQIYRGRLRGAITSTEGMVIPIEAGRGNARVVAELKELVSRGKELDRKLAPPPSWWEEPSPEAENS